MTEHNHSEYFFGCFRCDLSRDEIDDEFDADEFDRRLDAGEVVELDVRLDRERKS